jgi:transcriptional regulator with XRE-family HTH domain
MTAQTHNTWNAMSDKAVAEVIGRFIKEKRLEQNKTQEMLATAAGISRSTLSLLEKGETVTLSTFLQVMRVLGQLHMLDAFTIQPTVSPLQLAKMELQRPKKATGKDSSSKSKSSW